MQLQVNRTRKSNIFTGGVMLINGRFFCYVCEDVVRNKKIAGVTAIPAGRYQVVITYSPRFRRNLPLLLKVPNFEGIRIHNGNNANHTEGCLLLGKTQTPDGVGQSRAAMAEFMPILSKALESGDVWLSIS
jgi:hypothetical protein